MQTPNPLTHYIELRLRPDPEVSPMQLLAALYTKVHRALVGQGAASIAVSFPDYSAERHSLGVRLRLFGSADELQFLADAQWLGGVRDHVVIEPIAPVPTHAKHRNLRRVQVKSSLERLRRRLMKRHQLTEAQAQERIPDSVARKTDLPFLQLASASTAQPFKLFLALGAEQDVAQTGEFSSYGLSANATTPWF